MTVLKEAFHLLVAIFCVVGWVKVLLRAEERERWRKSARLLLDRALVAEKKRDEHMWELVAIDRVLSEGLWGPRDWAGETAIMSNAGQVEHAIKLIKKRYEENERARKVQG